MAAGTRRVLSMLFEHLAYIEGGGVAFAALRIALELGNVRRRGRRFHAQQGARDPAPASRGRGAPVERRQGQEAGKPEETGPLIIVVFDALERPCAGQTRRDPVKVSELSVDVVEVGGGKLQPGSAAFQKVGEVELHFLARRERERLGPLIKLGNRRVRWHLASA